MIPQGDPALLGTEAAKGLLASTIPARVAYLAMDGTPRVVPTWFHWTGAEIVTATFVSGPHVARPAHRIPALRAHPRIAVTIDTEAFPPLALSMRGDATVTEERGVVAEYALAARRYMGDEAAGAYLATLEDPVTTMARIAMRPTWVGLIDFQTRLPASLGGVVG